MQVEVTSMSKGRESHASFLGELRHLGRREAQEAGSEIWGFLGMCVCVSTSVFVHFQTHCSVGKNTFGGCVLLSLYSTMFSTEFFQVSLILV